MDFVSSLPWGVKSVLLIQSLYTDCISVRNLGFRRSKIRIPTSHLPQASNRSHGTTGFNQYRKRTIDSASELSDHSDVIRAPTFARKSSREQGPVQCNQSVRLVH